MKKYIKADGIKTDAFKKATQQAAINRLYRSLNEALSAMNEMSEEAYNRLNLSGFYSSVADKLQDVYPYYRG